MIYEINHRLHYQYSNPVFLDSQLLHLKPLTDAHQTLKSYRIQIEPTPSMITETVDAAGNPAHEVWFRGSTKELLIQTSGLVETHRQNPFNYLLRESALNLPVQYPDLLKETLRPYQQQHAHPAVADIAHEAANRAGQKTTPFLSELCLIIHQRIQYRRREEGFPRAPEKTIAEGNGSCRDMALLFVACCRAVGMASKFTSGYIWDSTNLIGSDLHAWAEVYLEGAGWRGYDPSIGLAIDEHYISLASAQDPRLVTPVIGTFRSNSAIAHLEKTVSVKPAPEPSSLTA